MRTAVDMILNVYISRLPAEKQAHLIHFLPDAEQALLKSLPSYADESAPAGPESTKILERVHWSWFLPTLKSYSPQEQSLFLAALDETTALALSEEIPCKRSKMTMTSIGRAYLQKLLLDSIAGPYVPIEYLPPSPLNRLVQLSKSQLIAMIDLLAMHDLAVDIRQIVETKILKKIYSFLTDVQRRFLKQVTTRHEVMNPQRIGLDRWDGKEASLRHLLHKKGIARLGSALSKQDPSLGWCVCHVLDIGRGSALLKLSSPESNRAPVDMNVRQVEELLGFDL
ncbi:MAG: hypothetical protein HW387_1210 [Parachlamydiales bacterium]|nr:hypothetical protein [Parachlamydiales bacterium]